MKLIKWVFRSMNPSLKKPVVKRSNIITFCGSEHRIRQAYEGLVNREEIHITSVSITRVDYAGGRGYVDNYMIAVSYDYYA